MKKDEFHNWIVYNADDSFIVEGFKMMELLICLFPDAQEFIQISV